MSKPSLCPSASLLALALALVLLLLLLPGSGQPAAAGKRAPARAYVQSGPGGIHYARCLPPGAAGKAGAGAGGRTTVYAVEGEHDRVLDRYDWFAPAGVALGWSPTAGKVAVAALFEVEPDAGGDGGAWRGREQLRFSIGGRLLKAYTAGDLLALGAPERRDSSGRRGAAVRLVGCEQVPGTDEYDFVVAAANGLTIRFDITTGERRPAR